MVWSLLLGIKRFNIAIFETGGLCDIQVYFQVASDFGDNMEGTLHNNLFERELTNLSVPWNDYEKKVHLISWKYGNFCWPQICTEVKISHVAKQGSFEIDYELFCKTYYTEGGTWNSQHQELHHLQCCWALQISETKVSSLTFCQKTYLHFP